jgi:hypothetical protein
MLLDILRYWKTTHKDPYPHYYGGPTSNMVRSVPFKGARERQVFLGIVENGKFVRDGVSAHSEQSLIDGGYARLYL